MLGPILCHYNDEYLIFKGTVTITATGDNALAKERSKLAILKNCSPFSKCISEINKTQVDNTRDIDVVTTMYNLIEYSDN